MPSGQVWKSVSRAASVQTPGHPATCSVRRGIHKWMHQLSNLSNGTKITFGSSSLAGFHQSFRHAAGTGAAEVLNWAQRCSVCSRPNSGGILVGMLTSIKLRLRSSFLSFDLATIAVGLAISTSCFVYHFNRHQGIVMTSPSCENAVINFTSSRKVKEKECSWYTEIAYRNK